VRLRRSLREPPAKAAELSPAPARANTEAASWQPRKPLTDETEPIGWLLARQRGLWVAVWAGVAVWATYWLLIPFTAQFLGAGRALQAVIWPASLVMRVAEAALFAWVASRFFVESRGTGELELLLTTPRGATTVISAHWKMLKRLFRWPVVVLLLPILLQTVSVIRMSGGSPPGIWKLQYAISMGLSCVNICVGVLAVCWMGMWFGLQARNQSSAIVWTVGLVALAPDVVAWSFGFMVSNLVRFIPNSGSPSVFYFLASWLPSLIVLGFYLWLIYRAKRLLSGDLRDVELQPLAFTKGFGQLWRDGVAAFRKARHWTPS
jgi:hypothetical protein